MQNLISEGAGYYFTANDYGWCTRCFIYFYVEITNGGRYYVTASATARNTIITTGNMAEKFVNIQQQDCYQYFVQSAVTDVLISLNHY